VKYASVLPKDYPTLNNQTFTYSIPLHLENDIKIGSKVLVPFGLKENLRLGYVLDITDEKNDLLLVKEIHSVIPSSYILSKNEIRFLTFVSLYFFIPLSNIFEIAQLFPREERIEKFYFVDSAKFDDIGKIRNKDKVINYLLSHKNGFKEELFKNRFRLKKNSTVLKNLIRKGIIRESFFIKDLPKNEIKKVRNFSPAIYLLNGLNLEERVKSYIEYIKKEGLEKVLIITPNIISQKKIKNLITKENKNPEAKIIVGSKFSILNVKDKFDLVIIDDLINNEYKIDKPIDFDLEKVASVRAAELGEKIIFGSFIPTVESFQSLKLGKIKHIKVMPDVSIKKVLNYPEIKILDLRKEIREHGYFDIPNTVFKEMRSALNNNGKSLILINRKGYYNMLICKNCGYVVKCPLCSIPLTYHIENKKLICRYCGHTQEEFHICPKCGGVSMRYAGAGTERFEKKANQIFKDAKVLRVDREIYKTNPFEIPDYKIAIGTTLALSLLDFKDIDLVALMGIDSLLNMPSFDSYEEALYLISRIYEKLLSSTKLKKIIIPTFTPYSSIFLEINEGNIKSLDKFYSAELSERKKLNYPPFVDFFQLDLESPKKEDLPEKVNKFLDKIKVLKNIEVVNTKPLLSQSPLGIYKGRITIKSKNILNERLNLGIIIEETKKNEKVDIKIKNLG
jgi:primosomal protein N' (replication factor Y)